MEYVLKYICIIESCFFWWMSVKRYTLSENIIDAILVVLYAVTNINENLRIFFIILVSTASVLHQLQIRKRYGTGSS